MKTDVTPILRNGHWPSYNVPYFVEIYELSGYPAVVKEKGNIDVVDNGLFRKIFLSDFDAVFK